MAWTAPATYAVGQTMTAAAMNLLRDNLNSAFHANSGVAQPKIESGTFTTAFAAVNATSGTLTFTEAFATAPVVQMTVHVGSNLDIMVNLTTVPTTTAVNWRAVQKDAATPTGNVIIHWVAVGT